MDNNQEISIQTQQKFEFYFLALVFTVLGLSIQTSVFSSKLQSAIEITGWVSFLISGLAGLSRMEWIPVFYHHCSKLTYEESVRQDAKDGTPLVKSGQRLSEGEVQEITQRLDNRITGGTEVMHSIEIWTKVKYFLHKWMFVTGLVLLVVSRAINLCSSQHTLVA